MSKYSVIIIDDDVLVREGLSRTLSLNTDYLVVGDADNAADGLLLISKHQPHIAFVDVTLPGEMSGIEVVRITRNSGNHDTTFFLITAYDFNLRKALDENPFVVLTKPIDEKILLDKLYQLEKLSDTNNLLSNQMMQEEMQILKMDNLVVYSGRESIAIPFHTILFMEADGNYCKIYTDIEPKPYYITLQLWQIEDLIPENLYIRTHRSYTVFKNRIISLNKDLSINLKNNQHKVSPFLSRDKKKEFQKLIPLH